MSNSKTVLIVRTRLPREDPQIPDATEYSYRWAEAVKQHFEANGWRVLDLAVDDAIRAKVEDYLQPPESYVFLFYGHGWDKMSGQDGIGVIDCANLHLLKAQKVYIVACWTAQTLGSAAAKFVRCYLGYDDEVIVWFDEPYAAHLESCVNKGILTMLDTPDCTIEQARQLIIDEYNHWIDYFKFGEGELFRWSFAFAADLRHNRDALQLFGDGTATLIN
jgi:hypothetical protein